MMKRSEDSLPGRIRALREGQSLAFMADRIDAIRQAAARAMKMTGLEYTVRVEGKPRDGKRRIAVYCGPVPEHVVTGTDGVRRVVPKHDKHSAIYQTHCGFREAPDRISMGDLKESIERGWLRVCRKRGWNPRWD